MATTTPNFGWTVPTSSDLVKNGAVAIETLGDSIDASLVDLKGGTTNQVLAKNSNTDMDFKWVADASGIPATIIDAKGDLIAGTAADTAARLAVGTNGTVLIADSTAATGLKWAQSGLTLITSQAFSAVSSQSINDCFSATYTRYKVVVELNSVSATGYQKLRFRTGGTDNSSANYSWSEIYNLSLTPAPGGAAANLDTSFSYSYLNSSGGDLVANMEVNNPFTTSFTTFNSQSARQEGGVGTSVLSLDGGAMSVTTSYSSFTIFPTSGTITGKVWVYGYAN
jgi:hypothetical protein